MKQKRSAVTDWQPGQHLNHLHQVWEYIERRVLEVRECLRKVSQQYYDYRKDASCYDMEICELLKEGRHSCEVVYQVVTGDTKAVSMNLLRWIEKSVRIQPDLKEVYNFIKVDIFSVLSQYCSDYRAIGMDDDRLYTLFRSKMASIPKLLTSSRDLINFLQFLTFPVHSDGIPSELLQCECEGDHIVTKLVPLTINFLEEVLELCHNWAISDKLYLEEVHDRWKRAKTWLSDLEKQLKVAKRVYNTARSSLQEDLTVLEALQSELKSFKPKKISSAKIELRQVKLEITALEKAVESIRAELADLDVPDCCETEEFSGGESGDIIYYQQRLAGRRQRWKYLTEYLEDYQNLKKQLSESKTRAEDSSSRFKKTRGKHTKLQALRDACSDKVLTLSEIYRRRVQPVDSGYDDTL